MRPLLKFYLAWALSSWGDRLWYFALSMYFIVINQNTLLITALNGFTVNLVSIFLGALIGNLIDKHQRISVARVALIVQNLTVGLSCAIVVLLLIFKDFAQSYMDGWFYYIPQAVIVLMNVLSNLASIAMKIAIERDWVIVILKHELTIKDQETSSALDPKSEPEATKTFKKNLAYVNAKLRGINLTTGIVAPFIAGLLMSLFNTTNGYRGTIISAICFALWNFGSCFIEYFLLSSIYNSIPDLKKPLSKESTNQPSNPFINIYQSWSIYMKQGNLVLPGIAFSFLFMTVLSFDSITLGYAKSQHVSEILISFFQGFGSIMGILATIAFPILHSKFKIYLPYIVFIGSNFQMFFLWICFIAIWLPGSPFILAEQYFMTRNSSELFSNETCTPYDLTGSEFEKFLFEPSCNAYTSIIVLLSAMAMSRFGLWLNDLSTNQIMQENIDENERGAVGGVQGSLNRIFDLIKFILVISFSNISYYGYLVIASVTMTSISFCMFTTYVIQERIKLKYSQTPLSENGPYRKSMIQIVNKDDKQNNEDIDSFDSFNEETDENTKKPAVA